MSHTDNINDVTLIMEFKAIDPEQHDFSLFKILYLDDIDYIFFIKTPSISTPIYISKDLAERIMINPTVGSRMDLN